MRQKNILYPIALFLLVLQNCNIDEPVLPRWTTNFLVPMIKEKIIFSEELAKDSTIVVKGDSLFLELSGSFEPVTLTSRDLRIEGVDSTTSFSLETIEMDSLGSISTGDILITEFLPFLSNLVNQNFPFPDTTVSSTALVTDTRQFQSMRVIGGTVEVIIFNHLPLTIAPDAPSGSSITLAVYNQSGGAHVADIVITDTIPPGGSGSGSAPLGSGDGWIIIPLEIDYQIHFLADSIFITQDSLDSWGLRIDLSFRDLELAEISGSVSQQMFEDTLQIELDQDEDQLTEAVIDSGDLQLIFFNRLPLATRVQYLIPDLVQTSSGQPLSGQVTLQPGDSLSQNIQNLHGFRIFNSLLPGQPIDALTVITTATSDTGYVTLRATDEIGVRVTCSDLLFRQVKGYLSPDTLRFEPLQADDIFDYGGFTGGIEIRGVQLVLNFNSELNIQNLGFSGKITGYHVDQNNQILDSAEVIISPQSIQYGSNLIILRGPEVDALMNILPTHIRAEGQLDYSGYAEVTAGNTVAGDYIFSTPFWVQISDADAIELDPDTLYEIDSDLRKAAGENITHALLRGKVFNFSPLSGELQIFFSRDFTRQDLYDTISYFNPDKEFIKSVMVPAAPVDAGSGFVIQGIEASFTIEMNQKELSLFHSPPLRIGMVMNLNSTNGFVLLRGSDYLEFSGNIETRIVFKE